MTPSKHSAGFTLIEVAMVMVIIGFILTGLFSGLGLQQESSKKKEDAANLAEIKAGLLTFLSVNRYLPCPDTTGDGKEDRDANNRCAAVRGRLPYQTLGGVGVRDAYGQPYLYAVNTNSDAPNVMNICESASYFGSFGNQVNNLFQCSASLNYYCSNALCTAACGAPATCNAVNVTRTQPPYFGLMTPPVGVTTAMNGSLRICNDNTNTCNNATSTTNTLVDLVPAVVVAFGKNGLATWSNCNNATNNERENCDNDVYFSLRTPTNADAFDDQITWVSAYEVKQNLLKIGVNLSP